MRYGWGIVGAFALVLVVAGCGGGASSTSSTPVVHNEWTWVGGASTPNQKGIYGTVGVADANVIPGARAYAAHWIDADGNLWLLGGIGFDSTGNMNWLNDMWKYSKGEWTWIGGSNSIQQAGVYGAKGKSSSTNFPGARLYAVSWTDPSGNFWLFGGRGVDATGTAGLLNDLWKYSSGQWTWVAGSNIAESSLNGAWPGTGIYGTTRVSGLIRLHFRQVIAM